MGRKTKKNIHTHYSRTYLFRPRNGLGLYYPRTNSASSSSIFQYNQRNSSPDSSLDFDEDVVGGILFTSYREQRGLENHSPLSFVHESTHDISGEVTQLTSICSSNDTNGDKYESQELLNHTKMHQSYPIHRPTSANTVVTNFDVQHNVSDPTKRYFSSSVHLNTKFGNISNFQDSQLSANSDANKLLVNKNIVDKSHGFLIKNILEKYSDSDPVHDSIVPQTHVTVSPPYHMAKSDSHSTSQSEIHFETPGSLTNTSSHSPFIQIQSEPVIFNPLLIDSTVAKTTISEPLSQYVSTLAPKHTSRLKSRSSPICKVHCSPLFGSSPNDYSSEDIRLQDSITICHISRNPIWSPQKQNYKICLNHAYIAWSIYAKETHLWEEQSREKGLYPLSLPNRSSFSRSILRPRAFREFALKRNDKRDEILYAKYLPPFASPYSLLMSESSHLESCPPPSVQNLANPYFNLLHSKTFATNEDYEQYPEGSKPLRNIDNIDIFNTIPLQIPYDPHSKIERSNDQFYFNHSSMPTIYNNQQVSFKSRTSFDSSYFNSIHTHTEFLRPILSSNTVKPSLDDAHTSNLPLLEIHPFESSS